MENGENGENANKKLAVSAQELKHSEKLMQIALATPVCLPFSHIFFFYFFFSSICNCATWGFSLASFPAFHPISQAENT